MGSPRLLSIFLLLAVSAAHSQTLDESTKLLIPIYTSPGQEVAGAHGSRWRTTLAIHNDSDTSIDAFPFEPTCASSHMCFVTMSRGIAARSTKFVGSPPVGRLAGVGSGRLTGGFLYVERDRVEDLSISLTFEDVSRNPRAVVSIPVVPEDQFFESAHSILSVPVDASSRVAVRVYDDGTIQEARIRLRVYLMFFQFSPEPDPLRYLRPIVDTELSFQSQPNSCGFLYGCPPGQYQPNFIVIGNLLDHVPELLDAPHEGYGIRLEFVPQTPGLRYWPMVTVTDNETSHTTVYTVQ